ncbi:copia protein [Tanacetum coccineum]
MTQAVPSKSTANVTYQGAARSRVPQAVLSRSTDGSYYPRLDSRRSRISRYSPSSRSSTTRNPHRPQRPKKIVKTIWVKKGSTVGSQAVLPQTVKKSAMISPKQTWKPKGNYLDSVNRGHSREDLKGTDAIIDSGCSGKLAPERIDVFSLDLMNSITSGENLLWLQRQTEFKKSLMNEFCAKKGIKREYSIARTPQQIGVAEEKRIGLLLKCNKRDERGTIIKNKARLVAQGYRQEEGVDYDEVFAPVARIEAIRLFLAFASFMGFLVYQMDVKSAFLYGNITEEVYVKQPPGFEDPAHPNKVYRVVKALYGLHQAPRACQDKYVKDILNKFDFRTIKPASTPIEAHKSLGKDEEGEDVDSLPKVSLYTLSKESVVSKHQPNLGLWYPKDSPFHLEAFSDSDYAGDNHDRRSTSGGCQYLGRRLVSWHTDTNNCGYLSTEADCSSCLQVLLLRYLDAKINTDYGFNFHEPENPYRQ